MLPVYPTLISITVLIGLVLSPAWVRAQQQNSDLETILNKLDRGESIDNESILLGDVNFTTGTATLSESAKAYLDKIAKLMSATPNFSLKIAGHTDNTGTDAKNIQLAINRSTVVKYYLISKNVDVDRLEAVGYGSTKPVAENSTVEGRALNRRVEMEIIKKAEVKTVQDLIILKNNEKIGVLVINYDDKNISYRQFTDTSTKKIPTSEVVRIEFADGRVVTFDQPVSISILEESAKTKKKKERPVRAPDDRWVLRSELLIGGSASLAYGPYMKYHKSFYDIDYPNADVRGGIQPNYAVSAGSLLRLKPFFGALRPFSIASGLMYAQNGFTNQYEYTYTSPNQDFSDLLTFKEIITLHYLEIPFSMRWDFQNNIFVDFGLSANITLTGTRKHDLVRSVNGSGAYNGGFDTAESSAFTYEPGVILKKSVGGVFLSMGINLPKHWQLMLTINHRGAALQDVSHGNFNTAAFHFHVIAPVFTL